MLVGIVWIVAAPGRGGRRAGAEQTQAAVQATRQSATSTPYPTPDTAGSVALRSSPIIEGVSVPIALTFTPDGLLLFAEAFEGRIRVAERTTEGWRLLPRPFVELEIAKGAESGVLGIALDPDYARNRYVYVYYSEPDSSRADRRPLRNRVVRFAERDGVGTAMLAIFDDIEISRTARHNAGSLRFGQDGKLYVTVGNAEVRANSQDLTRPNGKVLRLNPDGSVPADNPFPGSPVFAYGFRNPFGLAIHPGTGVPYVTENSGDSHDEVNRVIPGGNYAFPYYEGSRPPDPDAAERLLCAVRLGPCREPLPTTPFVEPLWESGPKTIGPVGIVFYTGDQIPQFKGDLFFCAVVSGTLTRLRLGGQELDRVVAADVQANNCQLDVSVGPDGGLYYSNMGGQIIRLGP
ncbi:MAG: PQQ-dependent sugar dehydrogenase [Chloroflexota bacterium]